MDPTPDPRITRVTFIAESIRAIAVGIQETAIATFAILIAVTHFSMGWLPKATITASLSIGLLGGLFLIPLISRLGWRVSRSAAAIQVVSGLGFFLAYQSGQSSSIYLLGICLGMGILAMAIPLQTHYLKENFPAQIRGRLFSISIVIRALSAMLFSWLLGKYLDQDMANHFPHVLLLYAIASGITAICQFCIPSQPFPVKNRTAILAPMKWLKEDRVFGRVIAAAMTMGIGVLTANALRVDYLANPDHPFELNAREIALITGIIPSITRLSSTYFWGWLFDRMDFFRLRGLVNAMFLCGILLYFLPRELFLIGIGSAFFGLARGGGEILWNLWVTKMDQPTKIAGYMSVHTFMTGLRVAFAPFIGFGIAVTFGVSTMAAFSIFFVILTFVILWPLMFPKKNPEAL